MPSEVQEARNHAVRDQFLEGAITAISEARSLLRQFSNAHRAEFGDQFPRPRHVAEEERAALEYVDGKIQTLREGQAYDFARQR